MLNITNKALVTIDVPPDNWIAETKLVSGTGGIAALKDNSNYLNLIYNGKLQFVLVTNNSERVNNCIHSVYIGNEPTLLFSVLNDDYNDGYVGFFSENCTATFANYYISEIN